MNKRKSWRYLKLMKQPFAVAAGLTAMGAAQAAPINLGVPDWRLNADTTLRFNTGVRVQDRDDKIAGNTFNDESDYKFDQGDIINARLDVLEEVDLSYQNRYGVRVSGAGWYDQAYHDTDVKTHPGTYNSTFVIPEGSPGAGTAIPVSVPYSELSSYYGNQYSNYTKRYYRGPSGEVLDAFAFALFQLGDVSVNVKAGQHTIYWGEGLFFGNQAISYSQAPIDGLKAITSPGIETKEVFLPVAQISSVAQLTGNLSVAVQYFLDWKPSRNPEGGTYLGAVGWLFQGPDRFFTGTVLPGAVVGASTDQPVFLARKSANEPDAEGNYGAMMRYATPWWGGGQLGLYYRKFDEVTPYSAPEVVQTSPTPSAEGGLNAGTYALAYNRGTQLVGASYSQALGGISYAGEVSYRFDSALNNVGIAADGRGPRGNLLNAVVNAIIVLPTTFVAPTGQVIAEIAYTHLDKITDHEELYNGNGTANCPPGSGGKRAGCSTDNYLAAQVNVEPQWPQTFAGVDLSAPISVSYGITGNYAGIGGGNQGSMVYSAGIKAFIRQLYEVTLSYQGSYAKHEDVNDAGYYPGGSGTYFYNDRGRIMLTAKTTF
ncbi:DUF1302 domain-containing protein [Solimonas soli]|jgi:hypothetical protein|uniref:DUF1302 domain-containing protein n=1 Tax=Solimonas soli TaxID=413479 RepID=UPI0004B8BF9F|nr:DUF1302 family protein [Solimonas soli]